MSIADIAIGLLIFRNWFYRRQILPYFADIIGTFTLAVYIKFEILKYTTAITHQILINCSSIKLYSLFTIFSKIGEYKKINKRGKANENTRNWKKNNLIKKNR